ncbi:MAG TPA: MBL fold metallo-hydrolase [Thermomicrobiales bacterium]|jgi:glyoxylase-like metal-dependent hydrolase (beta-lactamase superfamily II)
MLVRDLPFVGRLTAPNPSIMTGKGTNTYIFGTGDLAIIDPGPDDNDHIAAIEAGIEEMGGTPAVILVTHSHLDHLPGAFSLQQRIGVPIAAFAPILGVDIALRHDQRMTIGGHPLRALHTPGHAADHLAFLLEDERVLFSGDLIVGEGTVVIGRDGELDEYLRSLESLLPLDLRMILPGHGPAIHDPRARIEGYIAHRHGREREILDAIVAEVSTINAIVEEIYADVDPRLHPVAAQSVDAHLRKLVRDGRVTTYLEDGVTHYEIAE